MMQAEEDRIVIDFIDPLFAVVLNVSFAQVLMGEAWFTNFWLIWTRKYVFDVATLVFLGYATVVLSWIGYHKSIKTAPISARNTWGLLRFIFDVLLLIAYFILLVSFHNFRRILWTLVAIFLLYFFWDQFKRREHPNTDNAQRRGVTVFWLLIFLGIALLYTLIATLQQHRVCVLVVAISAAILYRVHKKTLWFGKILRCLGYPA